MSFICFEIENVNKFEFNCVISSDIHSINDWKVNEPKKHEIEHTFQMSEFRVHFDINIITILFSLKIILKETQTK